MNASSPEAIAHSLTPEQRTIVLVGPQNFEDADAIPRGLFNFDACWDVENASETSFWTPTELGRLVRDKLEQPPRL